jgi:predicted amidohydrolase
LRSLFILAFSLLVCAGLWGIYRTPAALDTPDDLRLPATPPSDEPARAASAHLVAIQPWLDQRHYQSADRLRTHLGAYLAEARNAGQLGEGSIAVFPEHTGTWLVAAGAPRASFTANSTTGAMTHLILANPLPFALALAGSNEEDRLAAAVFRMRAARMARDYQSVFSGLAREYGVTIVSGSIVLPDPSVIEGEIRTGNGPLYNVSAVFAPDGQAHDELVRKLHPIPDEAGFTAAATPQDIPVFHTPAGRLGVLICADSWHPDAYAPLTENRADLIAVPAFLQPSGVWTQTWGGYTTGWPADADQSDAGRLTEAQAWQTYSLPGRLNATGARQGVTAFLRGNLWDLGSDGANILVEGNTHRVAGDMEGASISALRIGD